MGWCEEQDELESQITLFMEKIVAVETEEMVALGFEPDSMSGYFFELEDALAVCEKFPQFHVYSFGETELYNEARPGMRSYGLAKGDRDPALKATLPEVSLAGFGRSLAKFVGAVGTDPQDPIDRYFLNLLRLLACGEDHKDPQVIQRAREVKVS